MLTDKFRRPCLIVILCAAVSAILILPQPWLMQTVIEDLNNQTGVLPNSVLYTGDETGSAGYQPDLVVLATGEKVLADAHGSLSNQDGVQWRLLGTTNTTGGNISNDTRSTVRGSGAVVKAEEGRNWTFLLMLGFQVVVSLFESSTAGLTDTGAMLSIQQKSKDAVLGRQMICGGMGLAFGSLTTGMMFANMQIQDLSRYASIFCMYALYSLPYMFSMHAVYKGIRINPTVLVASPTTGFKKSTIMKDLRTTLFQLETVVFLITLFVVSIGSHMNGFLPLLLESQDPTWIGFFMFTAAASATAMQMVSASVKNLCGGAFPALFLVLVSYAIRFAGYGIITDMWSIYPLQFLHSFGHGLFTCVYVEHAFQISPQSIKTTMISIATGLYYFGGGIAANVVGGWLYEKHGVRVLFSITSILFVLWSTVVFAFCVHKCRSGAEQRKRWESEQLKRQSTCELDDGDIGKQIEASSQSSSDKFDSEKCGDDLVMYYNKEYMGEKKRQDYLGVPMMGNGGTMEWRTGDTTNAAVIEMDGCEVLFVRDCPNNYRSREEKEMETNRLLIHSSLHQSIHSMNSLYVPLSMNVPLSSSMLALNHNNDLAISSPHHPYSAVPSPQHNNHNNAVTAKSSPQHDGHETQPLHKP